MVFDNKTTAEEILNWNFTQLYNAIQLIKSEGEHKINEKTYDQIMNGIKIKVPSIYIEQEWYTLYPNSGKASVQGYNKYNLLEFMEEIKDRETIIRQILIKILEEEEKYTPRNG